MKKIARRCAHSAPKRRKGKGLLARVAAVAAAVVVALSLVGCKAAEGGVSGAPGQAADGGAGKDGMGRYVEKTVFESADKVKYGTTRMMPLADGRLCFYNANIGSYISGDGGESWQSDRSVQDIWGEYGDSEKFYVMASAMSPAGVTALCYSENAANGEDLAPQYVLLFPDGTKKEFDMGLGEDEHWVMDFAFDESGRLFASVLGGNRIYEIDVETGKAKEFIKMPDAQASLQLRDNMLLGVTGGGVHFYDMEKEAFVEDGVLQDFIRDIYGDIESGVRYGGAKVFLGEKGIVYLAGVKGLYRHVIGGSAMEQMIDGNLSILGDPSEGVADAMALKNGEFLMCFSSGKMMKFTYDATISTVPKNSLRVYGLKENNTVRQAVSAYRAKNPDVYVQYEIGMEEGITREDALKALNTKILEGNAPDVFILDDMPVDSYIDKGVLLDIAGDVASLGSGQAFFDNLIKPFYRDGKLYEIPAEFMLPMISAKKEFLQGADGLSQIADAVEALRKANPGKGILQTYSAKGILKRFIMVCEPSWKDTAGAIDKGKLAEFLRQGKRIWDAVRESVPGEVVEASEQRDVEEIEPGVAYEDSLYFYSMPASVYLWDMAQMMCGTVASLSDYSGLISIPRTEGYADVDFRVMNGQSQNVYLPMTMAGISASSQNMESAKAFLGELLGEKVQDLTHYAFPIRRQSFEHKFVADSANVSDEGVLAYMVVGTQDGISVEWKEYLPSEAEIGKLRDAAAAAKVPYLADSVLENAIYEAGAKYFKGEMDLDGALEAVMEKVEIYLAE